MKKNEFIKNLDTGDLLLYNSSNCFAKIIEKLTNSNYSHISFILRDPTFIDEKLKGLFILESGSEIKPDALDKKKR